MKKIALIISMVAIGYCCQAQNGLATPMVLEKVKITRWGQKTFAFHDQFWDRIISYENLARMSVDEFKKVMQFAKRPTAPNEMSILSLSGMSIKDTSILYNKLNKLNMYKIATFKHTGENEKVFDNSVLRVTYSDNKDWDPAVKWDTLYFFIESKYVKVVK